jgi:hypothetical protein
LAYGKNKIGKTKKNTDFLAGKPVSLIKKVINMFHCSHLFQEQIAVCILKKEELHKINIAKV